MKWHRTLLVAALLFASAIVSADPPILNYNGSTLTLCTKGTLGNCTATAQIYPATGLTQSFLTVNNEATLPNKRVLTAGSGITFQDNGAGNTFIINATATVPSNLVQTLDKVSADTTVNNTAAETTIYSFSVPGGTLGTNSRLRVMLQTKFGDTTADIVDATLTFRLKYGGTTVATVVILTNGVDATAASICGTAASTGFIATGLVSGDGGTSAQVGSMTVNGSLITAFNTTTANAIKLCGAQTNAASQGTSAIDSTVNQTLAVTAQWSVASASRLFTMLHAVLEQIP